MTDEERIAYLVGDPGVLVGPGDAAGLDDLRDLLAQPAVWEEPDPGLADRVVAAIAAEATGPAGTTSGPSIRELTDRRRPRRRIMLFAVAAAAILVAVAVGIGINVSDNPSQTLEAALIGTSLAPTAAGKATMTRTASGWRITLNATGLPRLDNGQYYAGWLKNAQGILVPIGTFNEGSNVTLWSGVPATAYPTITVTRQLANGNPASSGLKVLVGTAHPT